MRPPRRYTPAARRNPRAPSAPALPQSYNDCYLRTRPLALVSPEGVIPLAKIGKGMFATVYRETIGKQRVFSVVDAGVYDKEIAAMAHENEPRNPHLPRVTTFGILTDDRRVYEMPFYDVPFRVANASPEARSAFTALRKCIGGIYPTSIDERGYETAGRKLECIEAAGARIPSKLVDAVRELHDASINYGDEYDFEFSPRNVATDDRGNLVLLDVLFSRENVRRRREVERRKAQPRSWW